MHISSLFCSKHKFAVIIAPLFIAASTIKVPLERPETILFLIIPLSNSHKATLGRLLTGIVLFNEQTQNVATVYQVILRFVFVYLIDSLGFYPWTGIYSFLAVPVLRLSCMLLNQKKNKTICDIATGTMLIEKMSYTKL